ncbi:hypothetical protein QX213_21965 [Vibrio vulnificus]|uniref:hypothetical protein n=1 Tax=Vibrio vulnificus TaxID=672 RepID=UPI0005F24ECD|nr:hypothetical protein [Vibrio vulnificus]MDS1846568.1 hypothetical protein [Vibrio vulnificus]HAS8286795.1 hypothetical protein [Vibrio vulnificus]
MYSYLSKIYKKNKESQHKRFIKRLNWSVQKDRVLRVFERLAYDSKQGSFIDRLYVSENKELRQIQLHSGQHPVGLCIEKNNQYSLQPDQKLRLDVESGAAIVLSQGASGEVVVLLYSFVSEQSKPHVESLVWSVLSSPDDLTNHLIKKIVQDFFALSRHTSVLYTETLWDRLRINYLSFKGKFYVPKKKLTNTLLNHWVVLLIGLVGSICSIVGIFSVSGT